MVLVSRRRVPERELPPNIISMMEAFGRFELLGYEYQDPEYDRVRAASLEFFRENGVPNSHLTGGDWGFWLRGRRPQMPEQAEITLLRPGESRRIAQITSGMASGLDVPRDLLPDRRVIPDPAVLVRRRVASVHSAAAPADFEALATSQKTEERDRILHVVTGILG